MLAYLKGKIVSNHPTNCILEVGQGMGFEVQITLSTYEFLKQKAETLLFTHLHIKKDGQNFSGYELYGFHQQEDKHLFELLISVSGIGANTARLVLNALSHAELRKAILQEDEMTISSVKGIGPKTAKRLILELKDKVSKSSSEIEITSAGNQNKSKDEALLALVTLGYQKNNVMKVLNTIESKSDAQSVEEFIKLALKSL